MVKVMKIMATSFKKSYTHTLLHSVPLTLQQATTNPCLHWRLLGTHGHSQVSLLLSHCSFLLGPDAVKVLHSICQQIWKTQQWPQDWKRSVFIPIQKKGNAKECSNYDTIALISHTSKVMLKILQASIQQ